MHKPKETGKHFELTYRVLQQDSTGTEMTKCFVSIALSFGRKF